MSRRRLNHYVIAARKAAGLTRPELALLLGCHKSAVAKYETEDRPFSVSFILGCTLIFGKSAAELFPALLKQTQDEIGRNAALFDASIRDKTDATSKKQAALLHAIASRTTSFPDV